MASTSYTVIWTDEAKTDLHQIYEFIKKKSEQGAINVFNDIVNATLTVHFSEQNIKEPYNKKYMRIIVRNYKILYSINEQKNELIIHSVFDTRQDPMKMKK